MSIFVYRNVLHKKFWQDVALIGTTIGQNWPEVPFGDVPLVKFFCFQTTGCISSITSRLEFFSEFV